MKPTFTTLRIEQQESIAFLILNRPKKLNALSSACLIELTNAAHWLNQQKVIKVVIIKGAGRTFSAGADIQGVLPSTRIELSSSLQISLLKDSKVCYD